MTNGSRGGRIDAQDSKTNRTRGEKRKVMAQQELATAVSQRKGKVIFKCDAQGDTVYIEAVSEQEAEQILFKKLGRVPRRLLRWSQVEDLPEGEELL